MRISIQKLSNYFSLVKFSHTIFVLPFAVIGFFLATKWMYFTFEWKLFVKIVLCMIFARNAAMAFNRYIDRNIDKLNNRTIIREIPSGKLKAKAVFIFVLVNILLFIITTYFINTKCFYLSPVALFIIIGYSYTKRFTYLCHFVLGIGLGLAPIGAYLAVTNSFAWLPLLFSFIVLFWVSGFDIIYALQDVDFDFSERLKSIPVLLGKNRALLFSKALHLISSFFVLFAGYYGNFKLWYWIGAFIFLLLLLYQHLLVKSNNLSKVNIAFFTVNGIASIIFCLFCILEFYI